MAVEQLHGLMGPDGRGAAQKSKQEINKSKELNKYRTAMQPVHGLRGQGASRHAWTADLKNTASGSGC